MPGEELVPGPLSFLAREMSTTMPPIPTVIQQRTLHRAVPPGLGQALSEQGCVKGFVLSSRCLVRPVWPGRKGFRKPGLLLALLVSRHAL